MASVIRLWMFYLIESCASREVDLDSLASANNGSHEVYLRLSCPVFDDELSWWIWAGSPKPLQILILRRN